MLNELKQFAAALASYAQAIAVKTDFADAYFNRGIVLKELRQFDAALASYDQAIAIKADHAEAHLNRGNVLRELGRFPAALASYDRAISIRPDYPAGYFSRGNVFLDLKQHEAAIASYDQAMALEPKFKFLQGLSQHARMQICDWRDFDVRLASLLAGIERNEPVSQPFPVLALSESGALQRRARRFTCGRSTRRATHFRQFPSVADMIERGSAIFPRTFAATPLPPLRPNYSRLTIGRGSRRRLFHSAGHTR